MFTLPVSLLSRSESHRGVYALSAQELGLSAAFEGAPVSLEIELTRSGGFGILARGKVKARTTLECSRCLDAFEQTVEPGFTIEFEPLGKDQTAPEELEDSPGFVAFHGEDLPLGEELRQELELTIPFKPVCKDDCRGLCAGCGVNLNLNTCECPPDQGASPFSALKDLFRDAREGKNEV